MCTTSTPRVFGVFAAQIIEKIEDKWWRRGESNPIAFCEPNASKNIAHHMCAESVLRGHCFEPRFSWPGRGGCFAFPAAWRVGLQWAGRTFRRVLSALSSRNLANHPNLRRGASGPSRASESQGSPTAWLVCALGFFVGWENGKRVFHDMNCGTSQRNVTQARCANVQ